MSANAVKADPASHIHVDHEGIAPASASRTFPCWRVWLSPMRWWVASSFSHFADRSMLTDQYAGG